MEQAVRTVRDPPVHGLADDAGREQPCRRAPGPEGLNPVLDLDVAAFTERTRRGLERVKGDAVLIRPRLRRREAPERDDRTLRFDGELEAELLGLLEHRGDGL